MTSKRRRNLSLIFINRISKCSLVRTSLNRTNLSDGKLRSKTTQNYHDLLISINHRQSVLCSVELMMDVEHPKHVLSSKLRQSVILLRVLR